ncbi:hypothetical protein [Aliivibrio fischeri]|uniref:Response regulator n=1 Tax=Aliivibrio fischeri SR5 TaxID=1088719 RepID=A0AAV3EQD2_ALIFS|nr:hypothetical protein [Aliivibrio fischeri]EHN68945.1 hypothetical protein VFSR5_A0242 [Aliivibrio fischeri SR5]MUJ25707.1 hypothetical protein [Aliivibrio fischeri]MUK28020.1 hypothetical protein [Aliivibrio fischeri]MUK34986.1 hypothetical protein [Aliivibrio fischeri]MUL08689.1 hypothetical protein [Aliivibrio fischeri]
MNILIVSNYFLIKDVANKVLSELNDVHDTKTMTVANFHKLTEKDMHKIPVPDLVVYDLDSEKYTIEDKMELLSEKSFNPFTAAQNVILMGSFEKLLEMKQYNFPKQTILEKPFSIKTLKNTVKKNITLYHN